MGKTNITPEKDEVTILRQYVADLKADNTRLNNQLNEYAERIKVLASSLDSVNKELNQFRAETKKVKYSDNSRNY